MMKKFDAQFMAVYAGPDMMSRSGAVMPGQRIDMATKPHRLCTACGAMMPEEAKFCGACGQPMTIKKPYPQNYKQESEEILDVYAGPPVDIDE